MTLDAPRTRVTTKVSLGGAYLAVARRIAEAGPGGIEESEVPFYHDAISAMCEWGMVTRTGGPSRVRLTDNGRAALAAAIEKEGGEHDV